MASMQSRYSLWNQRLLETYFTASMSDTDVWLAIDPDELDAIGADLGGDQGLLKAIRQGPEWVTTRLSTGDPRWLGDLVDNLVLQRKVRRARPPTYICPSSLNSAYGDSSPPTYLPVIAALIRSAAQQDSAGFYAHLQQELGLPSMWGATQMEEVLRAFDDLESWSNDCHHRYGRFRKRQLGGFRLVGIPRSQCAVPKHDSLLIGRVFARARLRPGKHIGAEEFKNLRELISESYYLTRALRQAAKDPENEFDAPLRDRLQALLDEWDGSVPIASNAQGDRSKAEQEKQLEENEIRLCLVPHATPDLLWEIAWRVPRVVDEGDLTISRGAGYWHARISGGDTGATTDQGDADQAVAAAAILNEAAGSEGQIEFRACVAEATDEGSRNVVKLLLKRSVLRILVPALNAAVLRRELWERPLPNNGPAYLLASSECWEHVQKYLGRNCIAHAVIPNTGLPLGWKMVCITACESLSQQVRDELPDGCHDERPVSRVIRLSGGRPVQQGGFRKYPAYDLPIVELDAPYGTQLDAKGLHLEELGYQLQDCVGSLASYVPMTMRRYRIKICDEECGTFEIFARDASAQKIGSITLRILADSVGQSLHASGTAFGLDRSGKPAITFPRLSGVVYKWRDQLADRVALQTVDRCLSQVDLGQEVTSTDIAAMARHPVARFLDSLALCGSMPYGIARDQICRLSVESGSPIVNPTLVLLDLRARGHIEIETNHMGRLVRIHAVAPVAYRLPVVTDSYVVLGILGALRLACWEKLSELSMPWFAVEASNAKFNLPAWRLLALDGDADLDAKLAECGLGCAVTSPAAEVLNWSCSIDEVRDEARSWGNERLIGYDTLVERFSPAATQLYIEVGPPHFNHEGADVQLLRCEDWQTRAHRVYSVGVRDEKGAVRFSFMQDSRWGVWLSMVALGRFFKKHLGISDGDPWPIPYLRESGTLLVPARLGLPSMLERALVLCSGEPCEIVSMIGVQSDSGERLELRRASDGAPLGTVSLVYSERVSERWLTYRWVPEPIAELLAKKIGGKLDVT